MSAPAAKARRFSLRFLGRLNYLKIVRDFLKEVGELHGLEPIAAHAIVSSVDEALANVLTHAYGGEAGEVRMDISADAAGLTVVLRHRGRGFDGATLPEPDLGQLAIEGRKGGLGIAFMKKFMDEVSWADRGDGWHECTLRKRFA